MSEIFGVIVINKGLWLNFLIPFAIGAFLLFGNKIYAIKEFATQVGVTTIFLFGVYSILFSQTTNLIDYEYWNGKISKLEFIEKWTEEVTYTDEVCSGSGNDRSCTTVVRTEDVYHSPYWQIVTSNGEIISITKQQYARAARLFGHKWEDVIRFDQVSHGDGNKYVSYPNKVIPTSVKHSYSNYVIASKTNVINEQVGEQEIEFNLKNGTLREYPTQHIGYYGETRLDRVIDTVGVADINNLTQHLNMISVEYGAKKEINPIIYITSEPRSFKRILRYYWSGAKKNDVVFIFGVNKESKEIIWSDVITYTDNTDFIVDIKNNFKEVKINDTATIIEKIDTLVKQFKRKAMKDYAYLKANIGLDWYWQLMAFVLNGILNGIIFLHFLGMSVRNPFTKKMIHF